MVVKTAPVVVEPLPTHHIAEHKVQLHSLLGHTEAHLSRRAKGFGENDHITTAAAGFRHAAREYPVLLLLHRGVKETPGVVACTSCGLS